MYNKGSDKFNNLIISSNENALKYCLEFKDFEITTILKCTYSGGSNDSDNIAIGTTMMSSVDLEIIADKIITNQEFLLKAGFLIDGIYEYAPMGYFTVQKTNEDEDTVSFKAYDRMQKFEKSYTSSLAYPTDSAEILDELCTICGIELATPITNPIAITEKLDGYTCREVLGYIAGIHGYFACIDRYGKLNLRWYSETPIEKQIGLIWSLTKAQSNYTVEKITLAKDSETTYTSGTGISGINYSNPYATQAIADNIYENLGGFTYRPCEISMLDDIRLDAWDVIEITYFDGTVLVIPVMSFKHDASSAETKVESFGKTDTENEYDYSGPITQAMDRMSTELLVANRIIATKVDAEWVNAHTVTVTELQATNARVSTLEANSLTAEQANLTYATIASLNTQTARIDDLQANALTANSAVITKLNSGIANINTLIFGSATGSTIQTEFSNSVIAQLGDAQIKSAMIDSVSADKITAGAIYTNQVKIYGDSSKRLIIADNTIQFLDNDDVVRMQVGETSNASYNIVIRNSYEEVIFDARGVTEKGYHDGSIKNIAVADNANIGAEKLNIDSLFSVINNDGSHTLKSSKIYFDDKGQTLDVAFTAMTTTVDNLQTTQSSQGTQISAIQGQISSKVWQQDIDNATTPLGDNITTLNTQYSSLSQNLSEFKTTVSSTYTTKTEFNNLEIGSRNLIRYDNIVQYNSGTLDKSNLISAGEIIRDEAVRNGGFRFDSINCYEPSTNYVLSGYITVLSGTVTNFRILNGGKVGSFISFEVDGLKYGNPFVFGFTEINTLLNDKKEHYFVLKYKTAATLPEDTGTQYTYFQPNSSDETAIKYKISKFNLQKGNKATDWTPAPEDVQQQVTAVNTIATQTADKFNWLVSSGTSATDFTLTDRVASLLSKEFNINALTTFKNSAENGTATVINGGAIKANTITADKININDLFSQNITASNMNIMGGALNISDGVSNILHVNVDANFFTIQSISNLTYLGINSNNIWIIDANTEVQSLITNSKISIKDTTRRYVYMGKDNNIDGGSYISVVDGNGYGTFIEPYSISVHGQVSAKTLTIGGTAAVCYLSVNAQNSSLEGGEMKLAGAGSYPDTLIDNYEGVFRVFSSSYPNPLCIDPKTKAITGSYTFDGGLKGTFTTSGLSAYNSRCSITAGGYYKSAGMVFVQMTITMSTGLNGNDYWNILTGMPTPSPSYAALAASYEYPQIGVLNASVDGSNIIIRSDTVMPSGSKIMLSGIYLT